jgi:hypothetical protein
VKGSFQVFFHSAGTFTVNFSFPTDSAPSFEVTPLQQLEGGITAKPNGPDISSNSAQLHCDYQFLRTCVKKINTAVKPAVQLLQIQEVHPVAHSSACNFCRFLSIFSYLLYLAL